jgi:predicted O-methyltransferase YrrM
MLARTAHEHSDVRNLRPRAEVDLRSIFADPEITKTWNADCKRIFDAWPISSGKGSVNKGDCRAIYYLISSLKPEKIVEVGTNVGRSTAYIATAMGSSANLTTVDIVDVNAGDGPWSQDGEMTKPPLEYLKDFAIAARVNFVRARALEYFAGKPEADLIFLDGSHAHHDVYREISAALKCLRKDGMILLHDFYPGGKPLFKDALPLMGPYRAVERFRQEDARFTVQPFGELPWPTKRDQHASSLALVLRS